MKIVMTSSNMFLKLFIVLVINITFSKCSFMNIYKELNTVQNTQLSDNLSKPLILTPYINSKQIDKARNLSKVILKGHENLESYSGYFTVDKEFNSNLFFWFFPAKVDYSSAPVILWLQGGPGSSSLYGLFGENGPLEFVNGNKQPTQRKYSWSNEHSVIYIDNPVGTGYSFTNDGYCQNETLVGKHLYIALEQFFKMFPELQRNSFFVTGESYAGKYVPSISYTILKNNAKSDFQINLKGIAIGNGLTDPENQLKYGDYLYQLGLIDLKMKSVFQDYETRLVTCIQNAQWLEAFKLFDALLNGDLISYPTVFKNATGLDSYFNYLLTPKRKGKETLQYSFEDYIQENEVREAIHVGKTSFGDDNVEKNMAADVMQSVAPLVSELLSNYPVLIYNGQLDIIVAYPLTLNYLQKLNFSGADIYKTAPRTQWFVDNELAGYIKKAGNLTEVLVRDAGHMVPADQPKWALDLITRFIRNEL